MRHPQKPLERMSFLFPQSHLERDVGCHPPPASAPGTPRPSTLTGDVELDGCLQGHLRSLECHPAGEVGAVVLELRVEE